MIINLNQKEIVWVHDIMYYEDIVQLLGHKADAVVSVICHYPKLSTVKDHTLTKGEAVAPVDGMHISGYITGNA